MNKKKVITCISEHMHVYICMYVQSLDLLAAHILYVQKYLYSSCQTIRLNYKTKVAAKALCTLATRSRPYCVYITIYISYMPVSQFNCLTKATSTTIVTYVYLYVPIVLLWN